MARWRGSLSWLAARDTLRPAIKITFPHSASIPTALRSSPSRIQRAVKAFDMRFRYRSDFNHVVSVM